MEFVLDGGNDCSYCLQKPCLKERRAQLWSAFPPYFGLDSGSHVLQLFPDLWPRKP